MREEDGDEAGLVSAGEREEEQEEEKRIVDVDLAVVPPSFPARRGAGKDGGTAEVDGSTTMELGGQSQASVVGDDLKEIDVNCFSTVRELRSCFL